MTTHLSAKGFRKGDCSIIAGSRYDDPVGPPQGPPDEGTDDRQQAPLGDDFRVPVDDQRRPPWKPKADRQIDERERGMVIHHVDPLRAVCQTKKGNVGEIGIDQTLLRAPARCTSIPSTISEAPGPRTRETRTSLRHQRVRPAARSLMISGMPPLISGMKTLKTCATLIDRIGRRIAKPGSGIPDARLPGSLRAIASRRFGTEQVSVQLRTWPRRESPGTIPHPSRPEHPKRHMRLHSNFR